MLIKRSDEGSNIQLAIVSNGEDDSDDGYSSLLKLLDEDILHKRNRILKILKTIKRHNRARKLHKTILVRAKIPKMLIKRNFVIKPHWEVVLEKYIKKSFEKRCVQFNEPPIEEEEEQEEEEEEEEEEVIPEEPVKQPKKIKRNNKKQSQRKRGRPAKVRN